MKFFSFFIKFFLWIFFSSSILFASWVGDKYPSYSYVFNEFDVDQSYINNSEFQHFILKHEKGIKRFYTRSLRRGKSLLPMMKKRLMADGLSDLFIYQSMVESGFSISAISASKAVGLWQFMPRTAKYYNLKVNKNIDERYDPLSSTNAAIAYLNKLHKQFGKWYLAMMAYNCGEGRLQRSITKAGSQDIEILTSNVFKYLPKETREYIQKILLVAMIGEKITLGFKKMHKDSVEGGWMQVDVRAGETLARIATLLEMSFEKLSSLNSQYTQGMIPTKKSLYSIIIPEEKVYAFYLLYELQNNTLIVEPKPKSKMRKEVKGHIVSYRVQIGDSLEDLARKYSTTTQKIMKMNDLNSKYLELGQALILPVVKNKIHQMYRLSF